MVSKLIDINIGDNMSIIKKLIELGYKENEDFEIFGDRENIDIIIIGESHYSLKLMKHQIEIIKEFKPKIIGHEVFNKENMHELMELVEKDRRELTNKVKEYLDILKSKNIIGSEEVLKEKYKEIDEKLKEISVKYQENRKWIENLFKKLGKLDIKNLYNMYNRNKELFKRIEYILDYNNDLKIKVMVFKITLKIIKEILKKPNINQNDMDKIINKYVIEYLFKSYSQSSDVLSFIAILRLINDIHLVSIDDDEVKDKLSKLLNILNNCFININHDYICSYINRYYNSNDIMPILQKMAKVINIKDNNTSNGKINIIMDDLEELIGLFTENLKSLDSNNWMSNFLKSYLEVSYNFLNRLSNLSNFHYDTILNYIIKNLKENEKRFLKECEENNIKKEDLKDILLYDLFLNSFHKYTKLYINIKKLCIEYNKIREKKMFETIKNLKISP